MRKAKRFCWLPLLLVLALFFWSPSACFAEVVQGQAVIDPSNPAKARSDAMQDAMRTFVEMKVGVHVTSSTETSMGMVVSDKILAQSDGYVQVNKIVKEWQQGSIYCVKMDLTASDQKIKTAVDDLYGRLQAQHQQDDEDRTSIVVAVTGRDEQGKLIVTDSLMKYIQSKMEDAGFKVSGADEAKSYMDSQTDLDNPAVSANIRRLARNEQEDANSLLRGTLSVTSVKSVNGFYQATVHESFELIGFATSEVNTFDDYYTAVDADRELAIRKAQDLATRHAVDSLGQKALLTAQDMTRGGTQHFKTVIMVSGITDRAGQPQQIRQALQQSGCRIIRSSFTSAGIFKLFVEGEGSAETLKQKMLEKVSGIQEGNTDENAMGSTKMYLTF